MARIEVTTHIEADPARVWEVLVDWEGQSRWMRDARSVTVLSPNREGTDVVVRCRTDIIGGLVVTDDMVTTEWDEPRVIGIRHLGWLIRGVGAFELAPTRHGTLFTWWEEIDPPLGPLGEAVTTLAVVPRVRRVFRGSLAALKRVCESTSVRP
ncbi:MAG TPA: SRPBCC family protein [Egibacteraceae bacterium]|nr:SRPBCC family protein [Egibacteraceae bacterium]